MLSLQNILNTEGQEFIDNLFNKEVVVIEKLNAATLSFKKKHTSEMDLSRKLTFYKGSGAKACTSSRLSICIMEAIGSNL